MIYLIPKPPDQLAKRDREAGWRHVKLDRASSKELKVRAEQLRDKGIAAIFCGDLDMDAAGIVRDVLNVTVRSDFGFRRFNIGRNHAALHSHIDGILRDLVERWKENRDIPIRGGDSLTSFEKRFIKRYNQLLGEEGSFALVVGERELSVIRDLSQNTYSAASLVPNGNAPKMDRIYKVEKCR